MPQSREMFILVIHERRVYRIVFPPYALALREQVFLVSVPGERNTHRVLADSQNHAVFRARLEGEKVLVIGYAQASVPIMRFYHLIPIVRKELFVLAYGLHADDVVAVWCHPKSLAAG